MNNVGSYGFKRDSAPKESIFEGTKNSNFFKAANKSKEIEILEGPKAQNNHHH